MPPDWSASEHWGLSAKKNFLHFTKGLGSTKGNAIAEWPNERGIFFPEN